MATLVQIRNRVLRMEAHQGANDQPLLDEITASINEAYREIHTDLMAHWAIVTAAIVATAGGAELELPGNTEAVVTITDSDGEPLEPRDRERQINYKDEIKDSTINTYALDRFDAVKDKVVLTLEPPEAGTYTVRHTTIPTDLAADTDVPLGPALMGDYLLWRARYIRLQGDEERISLMRAARSRSEKLKNSIAARNARFLREQRRALTIARR